MNTKNYGDDSKRLLYLSQQMDGLGRFDFHEDAAGIAASRGRDEPTDDDYLDAVRIAIDLISAEESECATSLPTQEKT
jgi:hypothetical protein